MAWVVLACGAASFSSECCNALLSPHHHQLINITMATLFRRPQFVCQCQRSFSTSLPLSVSLQWDKNDPEALAETLPPYPYGPARWYKQSGLGLYGGQRIQFGNNVSGDFNAKTRRSWRPNVFTRKLFSKALNRNVQVRVSARVLRTIDKLGGLDEYLLGEKPARVKELGESGWWLRWAIMQTDVVKKRFAEERIRLGLPAQTEEVEAELVEEMSAEESAISEEEDRSLEDGWETVPMDDTFSIEQNEELPPIKFRVGPGQHLMLTPSGWRRTRPDPMYFIKKYKQRMTERVFPRSWLEKKVNAYEATLDEKIRKGLIIDDNERAELIKASKRNLRQEMKERIDLMYDRHITGKEKRKEARRASKHEIRTAEGVADAKAE